MAIDFSKLGTKTKMFRGDDSNDFLFPTTLVSQIPVFFKKFFIEGFDPTSVTSCVASGGVLTITTGVNFKATKYKVVAITGASNSLVNKEYRVMEAIGGQTFKLYAPNLADGTYTGSISVKFAPLGWDLVAETSTSIALRSKVAPYNRYTLIADWSYKSVATATFVSAFMGVVENFVNFSTPYQNLIEVPYCSKRSQVQWCFSAQGQGSNSTTALDTDTVTNARWEIMKPTYWLCGDDKSVYMGLSPEDTYRITAAPNAFYAFGAFKPFNGNERHPMIFQGCRWSNDSANSSVDGTVPATQWYSPIWYNLNSPSLTTITLPNAVNLLTSYASGQANSGQFMGGACFLRPYAGIGASPAPLSIAVMGGSNGLVSGGSTDWETTYFRAPNVHLGGIPLLEPQLADIGGFRGVPYGLKVVPTFLGDILEPSGYSSVTKVVETGNANIVDIDDAELYVFGLVNNTVTSGYGAVAFPLKDWV